MNAEKLFLQKLLEIGLKNHYARNILYKSLSKSSYSVSSVDLSDIKNTLLKY